MRTIDNNLSSDYNFHRYTVTRQIHGNFKKEQDTSMLLLRDSFLTGRLWAYPPVKHKEKVRMFSSNAKKLYFLK